MATEFSARTRAQTIETLKTECLDVLVIGGGIVGAGIIRDLALNDGIRAGLIEQGDFGSGTSSATSQLVHGGFRYLSKGDIALVKAARREREVLLRIAPSVVSPLPIAILCYAGDRYPLMGIQMAAHYYNHLSQTDRAEKAEVIRDVVEIQRRLGSIETTGLKGAAIIWDSKVDDARLCLLTLRDAYLHGASVANYVRFLDFVRQAGAETVVRVADSITGDEFEVRAKHIVSATGPWTDGVWEKEPGYDGVPKLTTQRAKGIHILVPRLPGSHYGIATLTRSETSHHGKPRVIFLLPIGASTDETANGYQNLLLIGTTETHPDGAPDAVRPTAAEVDYLLAETQRVFPNAAPNAALTRADVIAAYAGIRPLISSRRSRPGKIGKNPLNLIKCRRNRRNDYVTRGHIIAESPSGVMYIYGGKLTTHRQIAEETVDRLAEKLGVARHCRTAVLPLLNEAPVSNVCKPAAARLIRRYGNAGADTIQQWLDKDATLSESLTDSFPFVKAEVRYAFWGEMAMNLEDFLWRRTRIGLTAGQGVDIAPKIAAFLGESYEWNAARIAAEVETYRKRIAWLNAELGL